MNHKGRLRILEWVAYPFQRILLTQESNQGLPELQVDSLPLNHLGSPRLLSVENYFVYCVDEETEMENIGTM